MWVYINHILFAGRPLWSTSWTGTSPPPPHSAASASEPSPYSPTSWEPSGRSSWHTVCPRSRDSFYILDYYIKWGFTTLTYSTKLFYSRLLLSLSFYVSYLYLFPSFYFYLLYHMFLSYTQPFICLDPEPESCWLWPSSTSTLRSSSRSSPRWAAWGHSSSKFCSWSTLLSSIPPRHCACFSANLVLLWNLPHQSKTRSLLENQNLLRQILTCSSAQNLFLLRGEHLNYYFSLID